MNRVIKHRQPIFDRNTRKFVDWHYWGVGIEQAGEESNVGFLTYNMGVTDPKDSQQFTGLLDKNGKEIYENDLATDGKTLFKVEWNQQQTSFWLSPIKSYEDTEEWFITHLENQKLGNGYLSRKDLEIIGNIHENQDLLQ